MFTRLWLYDAVERVIWTMLQTLGAVLAADGLDLLSVSWYGVLITVLTAGAAALGKVMLATRLGDPESASTSTRVQVMDWRDAA